MKNKVSTIVGMTMTLALAGVSLFAQTAPAPAAPSASKMASSSATVKSTSKKAAKHVKGTAKVKSTSKTSAVTPAAK
jgi:hypothetical protein